MTELEKLYSQKSFQEGKKYFHFANYPYLFKFIDADEKKVYDLNYPNENLVAICLSYDLDDYFHLVYNVKNNAYYLRNGNSSSNSKSVNGNSRLLKPIRIGSNLSEIFGQENFSELLIERDNKEYLNFMEVSFNQYEESVNDTIPKSIFPNSDLRLLYKTKNPNGYITDHKEYNIRKFTDFSERTGLKKYLNIDTFFQERISVDSFLQIINKANSESVPKFLLVEFALSGFQGIIFIDDLDEATLALFLKYGIIYNKIDVPEKIYNRLE